MRGVPSPVAPCPELKRSGLWINTNDAKTYSRLIKLIQNETGPNDKILVLPVAPEVYFLSDRKNPFRFCDIKDVAQNEFEIEKVIKELAREKPVLVIYDFRSGIHTWSDQGVLGYVKKHYELLDSIGGFEVYRLAVGKYKIISK
jgi:hypothetical protein